MRGISLDEIAAATKIGTRSLKALEDENFSILPGGIFNKGFVRAYARFLGLNEEEAVADYQGAVQEAPVSVKTIAAQSAIAKANKLAAQQARESAKTAGVVRAVVLLVISAAMAFGGYKAYRAGYFKALKRPSLHRQLNQQAQAPAVAPSTTAPSPSPEASIASQPSQPATTPTPNNLAATPPPANPISKAEPTVDGDTTTVSKAIPLEFTVSIKATEPSWMSITADGKRAVQKTFAPNEQQQITAKNRVRIVIGNPIGTELSLDGKPLPIGGNLNHPRTVVVSANGLASE